MKTKMIETAKQLPTEELKANIVKMYNNMEEYAGIILDALLQVLETRITENEFIMFCDSID